MTTILHQDLPSGGAARETLRQKGQFWTPSWVAEAMVGYLLAGGNGAEIFDPAVGEGAFLRAAKAVAGATGRTVVLRGREVDPDALAQARDSGLSVADLAGVELRDFLDDPPRAPLSAIVANPPYLRHHRLSAPLKARLKLLGARLTGAPLDGRAGLHVYFLLQALELLGEDGRLAFLLPADVCEGVFAPRLWQWIGRHFCIDAVITFAPAASPFPRVDTNALVFLLRRADPQPRFRWARVSAPWTDDLKHWTLSRFAAAPPPEVALVETRDLAEGLATGLSRSAAAKPCDAETSPTLGDYARVVRGIATGANEFFFLTGEQAAALDLPSKYLLPAIGRTRDVDPAEGDEITPATFAALAARGRPTCLLSLPGLPASDLPPAVAAYLRHGESLGLPARALIAQRRPWYKMETRAAPPFLFAYLGRRSARFLLNTVGVVPLTGFLCIYARDTAPDGVRRLWQVLRHPDTVANLVRVGKSYGDGAIKVEPRALERLPLPERIMHAAGLKPVAASGQMRLLLEKPVPYQASGPSATR